MSGSCGPRASFIACVVSLSHTHIQHTYIYWNSNTAHTSYPCTLYLPTHTHTSLGLGEIVRMSGHRLTSLVGKASFRSFESDDELEVELDPAASALLALLRGGQGGAPLEQVCVEIPNCVPRVFVAKSACNSHPLLCSLSHMCMRCKE